MHAILRLALFLALALLPATRGFSADKTFSHEGVAADAKRYETFLKTGWKSDGRTAQQLREEAEKVFVAAFNS